MTPVLPIEQIDAVLCEDSRTVLLIGYTSDPDEDLVQSLELPLPIEEAHFLQDEWANAARPDRWRLLLCQRGGYEP